MRPFGLSPFLVEAVHRRELTPAAVLTWQEEQSRFAFQNGRAAFMRNWPYAYSLLQDSAESTVAGKFAVAPMPAERGARSAAALGGSQLAINAHSDRPGAAYRLIEFLTEPAQMLECARVAGQYPTRRSLYDGDALDEALPVRPERGRQLVQSAVPRPVTPVYTKLSGDPLLSPPGLAPPRLEPSGRAKRCAPRGRR